MAQSPETCSINLRHVPDSTVVVGRGGKVVQKFTSRGIFVQDVSDIVVQITDCAIREQESLGNPLTHLLVNNRPGNTIRTVGLGRADPSSGVLAYKTSSSFSTVDRMTDAAAQAMKLLIKLTRKRSGKAQSSFEVYLGNTGSADTNLGTRVGNGQSGIEATRGKLDVNSQITIVGPNVVYGRKLYWSPVGSKKVTKTLPNARAAARLLGEPIRAKFIGTETIHVDVKKRMRRSAKWRSFTFGDPFFAIKGSQMVEDRRVPAVTIKMRNRGRIN